MKDKGLSTFGMRMIRELVISFVIDPLVKKDVTAFITSFIECHRKTVWPRHLEVVH